MDRREVKKLYDDVQSVKLTHNFNDRQALMFLSSNLEFKNIWGPPSKHKGTQNQWVETLETRLQQKKYEDRFIETALRRIAELEIQSDPEKFRK